MIGEVFLSIVLSCLTVAINSQNEHLIQSFQPARVSPQCTTIAKEEIVKSKNNRFQSKIKPVIQKLNFWNSFAYFQIMKIPNS